jgi:hypothetical protein
MDPIRFDHLTRLLAAVRGRRSLLGTLLGAALGGVAAQTEGKKRRTDRGNGQGKDKDRRRGQQLQAERRDKNRKRRKKKRGRKDNDGGQSPPPAPDGCCGAESCANPEPGSTRAGCAYAGRSFVGKDHHGSTFRGIDGRGAIFSDTDNHGSIFAEACLQGARFRRAKLEGCTWGGACLFGADFTGADLGGDETLFADALFCNTVMPDGRVNDRDCGSETPCCRRSAEPGPDACPGDCPPMLCATPFCNNGQCAWLIIENGRSPNALCPFNDFGDPGQCCQGACCPPTANACNPAGQCCTIDCPVGSQCGSDGCGGECLPGCPEGQTCSADRTHCVCVPAGGSCDDGNGGGNPLACCSQSCECPTGQPCVCGRG